MALPTGVELWFSDTPTRDSEIKVVDLSDFSLSSPIDISGYTTWGTYPDDKYIYAFGGVTDNTTVWYIAYDSSAALIKCDIATSSASSRIILEDWAGGGMQDCGAIDVSNGYAYFVGVEYTAGYPLRVYRLTLSDDSVDQLNITGKTWTADSYQDGISIDTANGFLYVNCADATAGTYHQVKIDLSDFSVDSTRDFSTSSPEFKPWGPGAVVDGYLYSAGSDISGASRYAYLEKCNLSTGSASYLQLDSDAGNEGTFVVADEDDGCLYVARTNGKIHKVDLATFTVDSTLTFTGSGSVMALAIDSSWLYASITEYGGAFNDWRVARIDKSDFSEDTTLTDSAWSFNAAGCLLLISPASTPEPSGAFPQLYVHV